MGSASSAVAASAPQPVIRKTSSKLIKVKSVEEENVLESKKSAVAFTDISEQVAVSGTSEVASVPNNKYDESTERTIIESFKQTPNSLSLFQPALQHIKLINEDPRAKSLFMKFLKDGVWIDSILSRFEAEFLTQNADQNGKPRDTLSSRLLSSMSIKFKQFALVPKNINSVANTVTIDDFEGETDDTTEELQQQIFQQNHALDLIKSLRKKEDSENNSKTIFDICSNQTIASIVMITALYEFIYHCHEFKRYLISNFDNVDIDNVKFKSIKVYKESIPNLKKSKSSQNMNLSKQTEYYQNLYKEMLSKTLQLYPDNTSQEDLLSNVLVENLSHDIQNLPFAFVLSKYEMEFQKKDWQIYYCNDTYCNMTQYTFNELFGKNPKTLLHNEHTNTSLLAKMKDHLGSLKTMKIGLINAKKDQSEFYNFMILKPVFSYHKNHRLTNSSSPHPNHHKGGHDGVNASNCAYYMAMCYDISSDNAKVSDLKLMEDCAVVLSYIL